MLGEYLGREEAIQRALRLRQDGMTYGGIALLMGAYHGQYYTPDRWRWECRKRGAATNPAYRRQVKA